VNKLEDVIGCLKDAKLTNITVYDLGKESPLFDYFIIANASNKRQLSAALDKIYEKKLTYDHIEGTNDSGWILLDMDDIIVNIMTDDTRELYNLDSVYIKYKKMEY